MSLLISHIFGFDLFWHADPGALEDPGALLILASQQSESRVTEGQDVVPSISRWGGWNWIDIPGYLARAGAS